MFRVLYEKIKPSKPLQTFHIVWNLLLADKQLKLTQEIMDEEKICHIVAILPNKTDFLELNQDIPLFPYTVLEYGNHHTTEIDKPKFAECGAFIDSVAKQAGNNRNVLVFCNNGYQRSIPFLVYYLTTYHPDEYPSIEQALQLILSQVDREHCHQILPKMVENITQLLSGSQ